MAGINYGRVALGALAGGVVGNIVDFVVNTVVLSDDLTRLAQRLNLNLSVLNSTSVALTWVVVNFVYAFLLVWTYAAIRPRFGPGSGTAVKAGVVLWAAVTVVVYGFSSMGIFTPDTFYKSSAFALVSTLLAALAGGYVYKE